MLRKIDVDLDADRQTVVHNLTCQLPTGDHTMTMQEVYLQTAALLVTLGVDPDDAICAAANPEAFGN